ncbi:MAG: SgcJ/EcaC family oxidoreductase [Anaerolineae bacterium]|nr:SgcJ/EcaC family oxidoreductase [Anaerolineae bacterium]
MLERVQVADVAQIYQLWNEVAAAANAGDLERWISLWIDDAIQMPPGAPRRVGKAEIRRAMQLQFDHFDTRQMIIQPEEVRILGDRAYAHGTYEFEMAPKEGDKAKRYSGKFLDILAKQLDGSWKIAIDCRNHDTPSRDSRLDCESPGLCG